MFSFQVGICCIAPPFIHITNNQELCRRTFGGKFCFNVPSSPSDRVSSQEGKSCTYSRKNATDSSEHSNGSGSLWKSKPGGKRRDKTRERYWKDIGADLGIGFGTANRAFDYEVVYNPPTYATISM